MPPIAGADMHYEREPPIPRGYAHHGLPGPVSDLIEYEVTEYRHADGTITFEERPLRRIPNSEAGRYYRDVPYERSEILPPPPPSYIRDHPPPPAAGEPYYPSYERACSRGPVAPPPQQARDSGEYDPRYPFNAPNEPMLRQPRDEPAYYEDEEYDPRFPNGPVHVHAPSSRPTYR